MDVQRERLFNAARAFCQDFASKVPLDEILAYFSSCDDTLCLEHGLPQLAPFLGRPFIGLSGAKTYFTLISDLLAYSDMHFQESSYIVDPATLKVSVRGEARFTWKSTANSWSEVYTYMLEFDQDMKVKTYEVWADSGAAYLASRDELHSE